MNHKIRTLILFQFAFSLLAVSSPILRAEEVIKLQKIVVTATREEKNGDELAATVGVADTDEIRSVSPAHPAEILNRQAGVHVNNIGGEGHMTAIRQPITTAGVYLYLEDGLPTRPTGFFNHNALYEINVPQADRLEVTKGPGSALYGSDAIGGIINSITNPAPEEAELLINPEVGANGWRRLLISGGGPVDEDTGYRLDLNITDAEGFRDESEYSRNSITSRIDGFVNDDISYKTILSITDVEQSGVSSLEEDDYKNNTSKNLFHGDVGIRKVTAIRLSTEFEYEPDNKSLISLTPFYRHNRMKMMPSWMVSYDANEREYEFDSFGFQSKYRVDLNEQVQFITGLDLDYTPSSYEERKVNVSQDANGIYTGFDGAETTYDYEADQQSISPYVHSEWEVNDRIRLNGGLRYDYFKVKYENNLDDSGAAPVRPKDQNVSFDHLSPKLGAVLQINSEHNAYLNMHRAFRTPSVSQLFRAGRSVNSTELKPVKADSFELGLRGELVKNLRYDLTFYLMQVKDDIVSIVDAGERKSVNAGETEHKGVELSLQGTLVDELGFSFAFAYSEQEYKSFQYVYSCYPPTCIPLVVETRDFAGFDVGKAPNTTANFSLNYTPGYSPNTVFEIEYEYLGGYYTDETNTKEYGGHELVNLRVNYKYDEQVEFYARVMNVGDVLYSAYTSNQVGKEEITYRPGSPRSFFVGYRLSF